ncbi:12736_t:CDS:2, partial [Racocetra persica]
MSLASTFVQVFNDVVNGMAALGIHVVAAAGNFADDACLYSPGSAANVITVGATDPTIKLLLMVSVISGLDTSSPNIFLRVPSLPSECSESTPDSDPDQNQDSTLDLSDPDLDFLDQDLDLPDQDQDLDFSDQDQDLDFSDQDQDLDFSDLDLSDPSLDFLDPQDPPNTSDLDLGL